MGISAFRYGQWLHKAMQAKYCLGSEWANPARSGAQRDAIRAEVRAIDAAVRAVACIVTD